MQELIYWLDANPLIWPIFIILARMVDVALGTMRTIFVVRGLRGTAAALGFAEVMIWVIAVSGVLQDITLVKVLSYGVGFALGNACGIWLEQKLAVGQQIVTMISQHHINAVASALRLADYRVTEIPAKGGRGSVAMCVAIVSRRRAPEVLRIARSVDEDVLTTVEDVRETTLIRRPLETPSSPYTGWRAVLKKK